MKGIEYQPWRPNPIIKRLSPDFQLFLYKAESLWEEYKSLATIAAEDWDISRRTQVQDGKSPSEIHEQIALTALGLKTLAWMTESVTGIGLIGVAKQTRRNPLRLAALAGSAVSLFLACIDYKDAGKAAKILFRDKDSYLH